MKKIVLASCFIFAGLTVYGIEPYQTEIRETREELELKKNKFLTISETDLVLYEKIGCQIDRNLAAGIAAENDQLEWRKDFDEYATRRFNMIRKVFLVFRKEYSAIIKHLEEIKTEKLPALTGLIQVLCDSLDDAKMKGSNEKWHDLKERAENLKKLVLQPDVQQKYKDLLILGADDGNQYFFEAKIRLLHRWLLQGHLEECSPWVEQLAAKYADHYLCLGLQSHFWFEDYKRCMAGLEFKSELEKKLSQQYGAGSVKITLKGETHLQKAFLFYVEALKRGYPPEQEIPGLLPAYWQYIEVMYKKIHPFFRYPGKFNGFRDYMKDLAGRCQAVVENVPFKKYASTAYQILNDIYRFWQEDKVGPKIIDYREIMRLNRLVSEKKF